MNDAAYYFKQNNRINGLTLIPVPAEVPRHLALPRNYPRHEAHRRPQHPHRVAPLCARRVRAPPRRDGPRTHPLPHLDGQDGVAGHGALRRGHVVGGNEEFLVFVCKSRFV
ncbi:hypothetical protein CH063_08107 [Colletotrichum higginsianum]|uniref:Uncharacterized protein n=1 Tax=Colletotrichum higginsianum (strain IMI 349063) TaxID=759273 RepID=H1V8L4_COLHI|nr:hypothetical protein CH063_08107 [Colletotrichum higginsianum]